MEIIKITVQTWTLLLVEKTFSLNKSCKCLSKNEKPILMAACFVLLRVNIGWNIYEMLVIGMSNNETFLTNIASYCVLCLHDYKFYHIQSW